MTQTSTVIKSFVCYSVECMFTKHANHGFDYGSLTTLGDYSRNDPVNVSESDSETSTDISHQTKICQL
jgi:hypothetical protein